MGVDKSYGSGKPRSAANSRARQRVAAKRFSKGKKNPEFNLVSKAGEVVDFAFNGPKETRGKYAELGVSSNKLASVAKALFNAGKTGVAEVVESRLMAKNLGSARASNLAGRSGKTAAAKLSPRTLASGQKLRKASESVFPRAAKAVKTGAQAFNQRKSILASKRQSDKWLKNAK